MSEKTRTMLWLGALGVAVLFAVSALWYVRAYSNSLGPASYRTFAVSAEGKIVAVPDVAMFTWSVISQGDMGVEDLQKENADKANKIIEFIKSRGIEAKDIKTESYSIEPRYQHYDCNQYHYIGYTPIPCPPPVIVGYTVTQTVSVKIRDFSKISDVLGNVVELGANSVSGISFTVDDPTALQNQARAEAIAKAKSQAKAIALAGGFKLGKLLSIEESAVPSPVYYGEALGRGGGGTIPEVPTIEPGSQTITVNMTLRYEIR